MIRKLWTAYIQPRLVRDKRFPLAEGDYLCKVTECRLTYDDEGRTRLELYVKVGEEILKPTLRYSDHGNYGGQVPGE